MNMDNLIIVFLVLILIFILGFIILALKKNRKHKPIENTSEKSEELYKPIKIKVMEKKNNYLSKIKKEDAIKIEKFNELLEEWDKITNEKIDRISSEEVGANAWIHIIDRDITYRLNADTKREGVKKYLKNYKNSSWILVENNRGVKNKVAFGDYNNTIVGFYLYLV